MNKKRSARDKERSKKAGPAKKSIAEKREQEDNTKEARRKKLKYEVLGEDWGTEKPTEPNPRLQTTETEAKLLPPLPQVAEKPPDCSQDSTRRGAGATDNVECEKLTSTTPTPTYPPYAGKGRWERSLLPRNHS